MHLDMTNKNGNSRDQCSILSLITFASAQKKLRNCEAHAGVGGREASRLCANNSRPRSDDCNYFPSSGILHTSLPFFHLPSYLSIIGQDFPGDALIMRVYSNFETYPCSMPRKRTIYLINASYGGSLWRSATATGKA